MKNMSTFLNNIMLSYLLNSKLFYKHITNFCHKIDNRSQLFNGYKKIYIDISIYAKSDSRTGIQRVVRELIYQILQDELLSSKAVFVIATKKIGYRQINYKWQNNILNFFPFDVTKSTPLINPTQNDIFLGLDFCPNIVPNHLTTFLKWKTQGVAMAWLLYDVLPISNPEWFTPNIQIGFFPWLKTVFMLGDCIICISDTAKQEAKIIADNLMVAPNLFPIRLGEGFTYSNIIKSNKTARVTYLPKEYILMVGTLEPRKGHTDIIDIFEKLWNSNSTNLSLVLVGKYGWGVEGLMNLIKNSDHYNKRLIWLSHIDDNELRKIYENSLGVIIASYNEGYGLPLIEALSFSKPVLARDIPIFREIAYNRKCVNFFNTENKDIVISMLHWLKTLSAYPNKYTVVDEPYLTTWKTCLEDLKKALVK